MKPAASDVKCALLTTTFSPCNPVVLFPLQQLFMASPKRSLLSKALGEQVGKLHLCRFRANDLNWLIGGEGSVQGHTPPPWLCNGLDPGHGTQWTTAFLLIKLL